MKLNYEYLNLNPKGKKASDCVIRAIAYACGGSWECIYRMMCSFGVSEGLMINEKKLEEKFIKMAGFEKYKQPKTKDNKNITIKQLIERLSDKEPNKVILVSIRRHLTVISIEDGVATLYDTWDCRDKYVMNYYINERSD